MTGIAYFTVEVHVCMLVFTSYSFHNISGLIPVWSDGQCLVKAENGARVHNSQTGEQCMLGFLYAQCSMLYLVKVRLKQKYHTPQVRPNLSLNPWPPDHGQHILCPWDKSTTTTSYQNLLTFLILCNYQFDFKGKWQNCFHKKYSTLSLQFSDDGN